jgi:oxygen-independent coproporphyrinogen-3 oxidase
MSYKKVRTDIDRLSIRAQMEEYMFLGLRMTRGISISEFNTLFGKTIEEVYGSVIEKNINSGLLAQDGDILRLTEYGTDVSNHVMVDFLLD